MSTITDTNEAILQQYREASQTLGAVGAVQPVLRRRSASQSGHSGEFKPHRRGRQRRQGRGQYVRSLQHPDVRCFHRRGGPVAHPRRRHRLDQLRKRVRATELLLSGWRRIYVGIPGSLGRLAGHLRIRRRSRVLSLRPWRHGQRWSLLRSARQFVEHARRLGALQPDEVRQPAPALHVLVHLFLLPRAGWSEPVQDVGERQQRSAHAVRLRKHQRGRRQLRQRILEALESGKIVQPGVARRQLVRYFAQSGAIRLRLWKQPGRRIEPPQYGTPVLRRRGFEELVSMALVLRGCLGAGAPRSEPEASQAPRHGSPGAPHRYLRTCPRSLQPPSGGDGRPAGDVSQRRRFLPDR